MGRAAAGPRCPVEAALAVLDCRWKTLVVWRLFWGARPFCELMRETEGITKKTLRHQLAELERHGLVRRRMRPGGHRKAEYALTPFALDGSLNMLAAGQVDAVRLPNLWNLDLRLAKNFKIGSGTVVLGAELFNALNANTHLYRNPNASSTAFNRLDEILAPRILRLGARLTF